MKTPVKPRASTLKLLTLALAAAALLLCAAALTAPAPASAAPPAAGAITVRAGNYLNGPATQTFTLEKQVFTGSSDCTSGGGAVVSVPGVDNATGHTITLAPNESVMLTVPQSVPGGAPFLASVSEQNGPFVSWGMDMANAPFVTFQPGPGNQICVRSPDTAGPHDFIANFYAGIELFDSCGNERYAFRPGETVTVRVTGALKFQTNPPPEPHRIQVAGGSPNECGVVPPPPDFTTVYAGTDPFVYSFTLPTTLPAYCAPPGTTSILGNYRVVAYDVPGCGCNRNDVKFTVQNDAPIPACPLSCPADIEQAAPADSCGANVNFTPPAAAPGETVTCTKNPGDFFPVGTTTVTCTGSPGGASCDFDVTVKDVTPPAVTAPANISADTDPGECFATGLSLGAPTTSDNCTVASVTNDAPTQFPVGTTFVTWTVKDAAGNAATATQAVTVTDAEKPTITPPPAVSVNADPGSCKATGVALGSPATGDNCGVLSVTNNAPASFPAGTTVVTWTVTDVHGNTETATQTVTVLDTEPPNVTNVTASPSVLWPPNHTMRDVALAYTATDNCGAVSCQVTSVTSDEPLDGTGDGNTTPDFEIVGPNLVSLRAERSGGGDGRQYTVTVTCSDGTNSTSKSVVVTVPKGQKN